jgi:hypothetical protein
MVDISAYLRRAGKFIGVIFAPYLVSTKYRYSGLR